MYGTYQCIEVSPNGYNLAKDVVNAWAKERVHRDEINCVEWIHEIIYLYFAMISVLEMIMW